uniref:Uncharacterized protein n=1 Tax=Branchiostoma floridae TaxID=7739 RepID=C3ZKE3_BRAFL|eukprot:XP_002591031.1 hypothetical protein BRAFLDRAFT_69416 [Branchiostoma floridae]
MTCWTLALHSICSSSQRRIYSYPSELGHSKMILISGNLPEDVFRSPEAVRCVQSSRSSIRGIADLHFRCRLTTGRNHQLQEMEKLRIIYKMTGEVVKEFVRSFSSVM